VQRRQTTVNWLDIVIGIILVVGFFLGMKFGLIKALLLLVGLVIGIVVAGNFYTLLADQFSSLPVQVANVLAYLIILAVVMAVVSIIALILTKFATLIMLGWINTLGGGIFGLFLGCFLCAAILAIFVKYTGGGSTIASNSLLGRFLLDIFPVVLALLPSEFDSIRSFFD
jgi:membrane protein required for colicin V production